MRPFHLIRNEKLIAVYGFKKGAWKHRTVVKTSNSKIIFTWKITISSYCAMHRIMASQVVDLDLWPQQPEGHK